MPERWSVRSEHPTSLFLRPRGWKAGAPPWAELAVGAKLKRWEPAAVPSQARPALSASWPLFGALGLCPSRGIPHVSTRLRWSLAGLALASWGQDQAGGIGVG